MDELNSDLAALSVYRVDELFQPFGLCVFVITQHVRKPLAVGHDVLVTGQNEPDISFGKFTIKLQGTVCHIAFLISHTAPGGGPDDAVREFQGFDPTSFE
jgi:hypothetical protein